MVVVDREIGLKRLYDALPNQRSGCRCRDQDILVTAAKRYSVLRRFSLRFPAAFRFESNVLQDRVLAAVEVLKAMDRDEIGRCPPARRRRSCRRDGAN